MRSSIMDPTSASLSSYDQETPVTTTTSRDSDRDLESKTVIVEKIQMPDGGEKVITKIINCEDKNGD